MRRLAAFTVLLLLTACDTRGGDLEEDAILDPARIDLRTLSQEEMALMGTWDWVVSMSYFTPSGEPAIETPETSGRTARWMFLADGQALYYENGELTRETTYEVRKRGADSEQTDALPSIQFGDDRYGIDFGTAGDMLVIDGTPFDGPQARYKRK